MIRLALIAIVLVALPASAGAQRRQHREPAPPAETSTETPLPSIGLPLPPIGLPLPRIGLDPPQPRIDSRSRLPGTGRDRPPRHGRGRTPAPILVFGAPYAFGIDPRMQATMPGQIVPEPEPAPPIPTYGILRLDVAPADLVQIWVDGEYAGVPADFPAGLELEAGSHHIELRAPGYETVDLHVRITADREVTYRGRLNETGPPQAARPGTAAPPPPPAPLREPKANARAKDADKPPPPPQTFYLIPGCYLGNIPPEKVTLPEGCDLSRVIKRTP